MDSKTIETDVFTIEVPKNWKLIEEKGIDSYVGKFVLSTKNSSDTLSFDFSEKGYANPLVPSEAEYIDDYEWEWKPANLFIKPGIYYTTGDIEAQRKQLMQEQGIADPKQIKVEPYPKANITISKEQADSTNYIYTAHLTYNDSTVTMRIELPDRVLNHHITVDTVGKYLRKLIQPRDSVKGGTTGVYIKDLTSSLNLQINGEGLPYEVQEQAVKAFRTIKIK